MTGLVEVTAHNCRRMTAEACHGVSTHWVEIILHGAKGETQGFTVFLDGWEKVEAYAAAINSVIPIESKTIMARTVQAVQPECAA